MRYLDPKVRQLFREFVQTNGMELIIVHYEDGSNDFFSNKPEAEECERQWIVEVCKSIVQTIEDMPRKMRSDKGSVQSCPGNGNRNGSSRCP